MTNNESPLDVTDIVMIDPVQTGFSRAADGEDSKQFTGVTGDIESVADFMRRVAGIDWSRCPHCARGHLVVTAVITPQRLQGPLAHGPP